MRVRKALYQTIDTAALLRDDAGLSKPTGAIVSPRMNGWTEAVDKRLPFDANAARRCWLIGLQRRLWGGLCLQQQRHHQDEELCRAITSMWSRIGVKARSCARCPPSTTPWPSGTRPVLRY